MKSFHEALAKNVDLAQYGGVMTVNPKNSFRRRVRGLVPFSFAAKTLLVFVIAWSTFCASAVTDPNRCGVCEKLLGMTIYTITDKVKHEKVFLCYDCATNPDECYLCGVPVGKDSTALADGRVLCARDARTAVLDSAKAMEMSEQLLETLERRLSRFLSLPSTNINVALVDRVNLYDEFSVVGNDFECPDILGYIHSKTNRGGGMQHSISIMSALPLAEFYATCVHEVAHAWMFENVSPQRRKALSRDATEGFCELLAYRYVESLDEKEQMSKMLRNTYTRGQIDLFLAAEKEFGLNDVLDWMRWGVNTRLRTGNLADIRNVEMPAPDQPAPATNTGVYARVDRPAPTTLMLKGISSSRNQPLALINDQTFTIGETARVRVGLTNVLIKCLSISADSVKIQRMDSGVTTNLFLSGRSW